mmetsp:Transcript_37775/g.93544  ORF Transcript_37775/g.93544 Transcript_37775/m.93544 type:complete len:92 (-) Transcript_37775:787-1062(-)
MQRRHPNNNYPPPPPPPTTRQRAALSTSTPLPPRVSLLAVATLHDTHRVRAAGYDDLRATVSTAAALGERDLAAAAATTTAATTKATARRR